MSVEVYGDAWAVVVARTGPTAKQRLADLLEPPERSALALLMLADVLAACRRAPFAGIVVVTDSADGAARAAQAGALAESDPGGGMNQAVRAGIRAATAAGARTVLVLPGDVPLVTPEDLAAVLAAAEEAPRAVVVATDRTGTGTNGLLLWPPDAIAPSFGVGSRARHLALATEQDVPARRVYRERLAQDVDLPADLAALADRSAGTAGPFARDLLGRHGVDAPAARLAGVRRRRPAA